MFGHKKKTSAQENTINKRWESAKILQSRWIEVLIFCIYAKLNEG